MILLDTCTLLWLTMESARLSSRAAHAIREHPDGLFVCAISAYEIALKHRQGKLELPQPPTGWFPRACALHGLRELPLTSAQALQAASLPEHHRDPFDRLLIATALDRRLTLLTPDPLIHQYQEITALW